MLSFRAAVKTDAGTAAALAEVAVGTIIADRPCSDPYERSLAHTALISDMWRRSGQPAFRTPARPCDTRAPLCVGRAGLMSVLLDQRPSLFTLRRKQESAVAPYTGRSRAHGGKANSIAASRRTQRGIRHPNLSTASLRSAR
jgi:hypothetical protein